MNTLELTAKRMKEFGLWLLSLPEDLVTLSEIAEGTRRIFELNYCSIHVCADGKSHHFSGSSTDSLSKYVADSLKVTEDHRTDVIELAEEQALGVRYSTIRAAPGLVAVLAVRSDYLSMEAIDTIASMIGMMLLNILRDRTEPALSL
ncbi:hypothetical protein L0222_27500 [bacterium]|nr:hypothetical protein [bacterium]